MTNIDRIRQAMPEYNCDSILITEDIDRLFATGFSSSAGVLFITLKDAWYFADSRYIEVAKATITDAEVLLYKSSEPTFDNIKKTIKDNNIKSIGFEDMLVSFTAHKDLQKIFDIELVPVQKLINDLREIKSRADLEGIIQAQRLSEEVFNEILPIISTDMTEKDLAAELIYRCLKKGADDMSFSPIVVSGPNSSKPHGVPSTEKIANGFLTIDFGVRLNGWCSDTTRTLCVGKPDDEMVNIYNIVLKAQEAGIKAIHGGVKGFDVDAAARKVIADAGYGDYFGHGFGHSQGLEVHESLSASPLSKHTLPAGAVLSAEPGIYIPGKYGVRIEDTIYITENGSENITKLSKELTII
ncbi:MAG: Xaa-Pro peptidase family protein [Oscillospiraceae bacterium]|nr:Xaa-Pro peptidase family protein [Oscillospiraceae bacterium]